MAELNLAAAAPPIFLDGNYVDRHGDDGGDLVVSDALMHSLRHRLYDMVPQSYAASGAAASDATAVSITAGLWVEGAQAARSVDYIALLNHNFAAATLELSDDNGASYPTSISKTGLTSAWTHHSIAAPVSANKIRVSASATQVADAEKQLGLLLVGLARFQAPRRMAAYAPWPEAMEKSARMGDGSIRRAIQGRADLGNRFYRASVGFRGLTLAQLRQFEEQLLDNYDPFIFIPEPGDRPDVAPLCRIVPGSWRDPYLSKRRAAGYELTFDVEELGEP